MYNLGRNKFSQSETWNRTGVYFAAIAIAFAIALSGCSTFKSVLGSDTSSEEPAPIENPFQASSTNGDGDSESPGNIGAPYASTANSRNMVLRTRRGNRAVEVELPESSDSLSELAIPVNPLLPTETENYATAPLENDLSDRRPSASDREIISTLPEAPSDVTSQRQNIEEQLRLIPSQDKPAHDRSYLAAMDKVKTLYRHGRFEAALLETDELLRDYPTDPRVYEMRGTLFDRIRRPELALKNWRQALRLEPQNESLRRFIEKKEASRGLASP